MTILCMQSEYEKMCLSGRTDTEREKDHAASQRGGGGGK